MSFGPEIERYLRNATSHMGWMTPPDASGAAYATDRRLVVEYGHATRREVERRIDKALASQSFTEKAELEGYDDIEERETAAVKAEVSEILASPHLQRERLANTTTTRETPPPSGPVRYMLRDVQSSTTPQGQDRRAIEPTLATPQLSLFAAGQSAVADVTLYEPLNVTGHDVRILLLEPGAQDDIRIKCELVPASLEEGPIYEALSYVWDEEALQIPGEPRFVRSPKAILLHNKLVSVSANLYDALRHLRRRDRVRRLWVDALCIDQANISERNHQVAQMAKIYSTAWRTISWLGPQTFYGAKAMELIKRLPAYSDESWLMQLTELCAEESLQANWKALGLLFNNTYWTRVWITQEVILSKDILFVCGTESCTKEEFFRPRHFLRMTRLNHGNGTNSAHFAFRMFPDHIAPLLTLYEHRRKSLELSVVDVLFLNRSRDATDNRDKLYAIQGLLKTPAVTTDYALSASELYKDIFWRLVELDGNLDVLSVVRNTVNVAHRNVRSIEALAHRARQNCKQKLNLYEENGDEVEEHPWSSCHINDVLDAGDDNRPSRTICWHRKFNLGESEIYLPRRHTSYFRATQDSKPSVQQDGEILRLRGQILSKVVAYGPCSNIAIDHEAQVARREGHGDKIGYWKVLWDQWNISQQANTIPNVYGNKMAQLKAFQATMVLGSDREGGKDRTAGSPLHNQLYHWTGLPGTEWTLDNDDPEYVQKWQTMADIFEMMSTRSILTSSKFFVTASGHMGIGPRDTAMGDVVCLFLGARVPFVIAPLPDEVEIEREDPETGLWQRRKITTERMPGNEQLYYLVGDCYLHGAMEGEMFTAPGEEDTSEVISLL